MNLNTKKGKTKINLEKILKKILSTYEKYAREKRYSKNVSIGKLKNDFNLNIRRYADTSPPPEQFDTKAILNGGIPVGEIEDDYIQETSGNGCELRLNKRDDKYYEFKPEIETKERIREFLNTDNSLY